MSDLDGVRSRRLRVLLAAFSALALVAALAPVAAAQEDDSSALRAAKDGYDEAVAAEAEALAGYESAVAGVAALDQRAAALDREVAGARRNVEIAQAELDAAQARSLAAERRLDTVTRALRAALQRLRDQAVAAYIGGGSGSELVALFAADSAGTAERAQQYSRAILEDQQRTVATRDRLRAEAASTARTLEEASRRAIAARDVVRQQQAALEAARRELAGIQAEARAGLARQAQYLAEVQGRRVAYQQRIALLTAESDSIAAMLRDIQSAQVPRADTRGFFADPLDPMVVTSGFGPRVHPVFGDVRTHNGIDLSASTGDPIDAAAPGVVVWAGERGGYGNCVIIDHGGQLATLYAHQSRVLVQRGQAVAKGQAIGEVGSTGVSTGPHLHFEIRVFGNPTDPEPFLP